MTNNMIRIPKGCVLWFDLMEDTGNVIFDRSGKGNNGIVYGATLYKQLPYRGRYFDGIDDYVLIYDSPSLDITDEITCIAVAYWERYPDVYTDIIAKPFAWHHGIWVTSYGYIGIEIYDGTTFYNLVPLVKVPLKTWHVIMTRFSSELGIMDVWLNMNRLGVRTNLAGVKINTNNSNAGVGHATAPGYFPGYIAHVSVYERFIEVEEYKRLYEAFQRYYLRRFVTYSDVRVR